MFSINRKYKVTLFILIIIALVVVGQFSFDMAFCIKCRDSIRVDESLLCLNNFNRILTVYSDGGLGNKIWEYMSLLAFQKMYFLNGTILLPSRTKNELQNVFAGIENPIIPDVPKFCILGAQIKKFGLKEKPKSFNFFQNNLVVILHGYSCRYLEVLNYGLENIKQKLRFHQKWIDKGTLLLKSIKASFGFNGTDTVTFIGVHYRGGAYNSALEKGPPFFRYYSNAMKYFTDTTKNPIFVFSTIDNNWAAKNYKHLQNFKIVKLDNVGTVDDLVTLSLCNHSIINYGTYGSTAALFANRTTFVYDLKLPDDGRGFTLATSLAKVIPNWFLCDNRSPCNSLSKT